MNPKSRRLKLQKAQKPEVAKPKQQDLPMYRWTVLDSKREYDALEDPHASYFFANKSIKNHLKNIKKAAIKETRNSKERDRLRSLYNQKIKQRDKEKSLQTKTKVYQLEEKLTNEAIRKASIKSMRSQRSDRLEENRYTLNSAQKVKRYLPSLSQELKPQTPNVEEERPISKRKRSKRKHASKRLSERETTLEHEKLLTYISQKRTLVQELQKRLQEEDQVTEGNGTHQSQVGAIKG